MSVFTPTDAGRLHRFGLPHRPYGIGLIGDDEHLGSPNLHYVFAVFGWLRPTAQQATQYVEIYAYRIGYQYRLSALGGGTMGIGFSVAILDSRLSANVLQHDLLKLLPQLHYIIATLVKVISLLLIQDMLAIIAIVSVSEFTPDLGIVRNIGSIILALPMLALLAF